MAGTERSGRRGAPRNDDGTMAAGCSSFEPDPGDPPPDLVDVASCMKFAAWIARQQANGMDPRTADAFNTSVKTFMAAIRTDHGLNELTELRELVRVQRAAVDEIKTRDERGQYTPTGTASTTGRRKAAPDGEPH